MPLLYNRQQPCVFHHIHLCPFAILSGFQFPVVFQTSFPMSIDLSSDSTMEMVVPNQNLPVTSPSHQNRRAGSSQQDSSSFKLRGLMPLKGGKWGARISYNYKRYSLGTYETEIEAAIAYDRAALKMPRAHPLNFHRSNYTVEESAFQSRHSVEEILKTFMKEQGIVYECVLQKELTPMDVTHKCFLVQGDYSSVHFPTQEHECLNSTATLYDIHGFSWTFGCSYWHGTQSFLLTSGWGDFLKKFNLKERDLVLIYRCWCRGDTLMKNFYLINVLKTAGESSVGGSLNKRGVKLFGVEISG